MPAPMSKTVSPAWGVYAYRNISRASAVKIAGGAARPSEACGILAPRMTEAAVVTPVGAAKDGRDISEGMRHRHPGSTPGFEHTGQLTQGCPIVRDMLEHGDCDRRADRAGAERELLRGAADPQSPL